MNDAERRELNRMAARLADLERTIKGIPSRFGPGVPRVRLLRVDAGNELISAITLFGLRGMATGSAIEFVPTAVPVIATTYTDGLSAATDMDSSEVVWIASTAKVPGGTAQQDLIGDLIENTPVLCVRSLLIPIGSAAGTTFAEVWLPFRRN